jgi:phosphatidylserine/phosphatidylglycerophosphate/cardiolipin synthase-like enzyme
MRAIAKAGGMTVRAVAGTHSVTLAMDLSEAARRGCLGFAIQRTDHDEKEKYWMRGMKVFAGKGPPLARGQDVSSREHPFQAFQWFDYTAKPGHRYTYRVVAMGGTPERLREGREVQIEVQTEAQNDGRHGIYFNRGACSSQAYARRFENRPPDEAGPAAYEWLSRGLYEGLLGFIERAEDERWSIHGAIYEFQWAGALEALRAARKRKAKLRVIVDVIESASGPHRKNLAAIEKARLGTVCVHRTTGKIMHNKFLVLSRDGRPVALWTGSTNWTQNGIFGHSNCGHVVEDAAVARAYRTYWEVLAQDLTSAQLRAWNAEHAPAPPDPWEDDNVAVFSPRTGLSVLDWYAQIAGSAESALFMTFAFGMNERFLQIYERNDRVLRYALMEKEGNGQGLAQGRIDIRRVRRRPNVIVAVANNLALNVLDRWVEERASISEKANVRWIHTKYALVDPLGEAPVVITGSANFSKASTDANDENMLVIRNDLRVADIYFTEFMRLHSHYAFREAVKIARDRGEDFEATRAHLTPDTQWQDDHYRRGTDRFLRRRYFAGVSD